MGRGLVLLGFLTVLALPALGRDASTAREQDRGTGLPLSMFGTYIEKGDFLIYPFFEGYVDGDSEYSPAELGYGLDQDFRGRYSATEELIFLAYGIHERIAIEFEAALIQATQKTASEDPSSIPDEVSESGLGDVEGQLRWRYADESAGRPEFFGYFETVFPTQDEGSLIGTTDWEFKLGSGAIRSWGFGTLALRGAVAYDRGEDHFEVGEAALEYVRQLNRKARVYLGVEGAEDEWELIGELQLRLLEGVVLKLNNAVGVTDKATDWAPEVGIVFRFPRR